eukprot:scaffold434_cov186-Pinguiococcus_pyrenoidosus.AAC.155
MAEESAEASAEACAEARAEARAEEHALAKKGGTCCVRTDYHRTCTHRSAASLRPIEDRFASLLLALTLQISAQEPKFCGCSSLFRLHTPSHSFTLLHTPSHSFMRPLILPSSKRPEQLIHTVSASVHNNYMLCPSSTTRQILVTIPG